MPNKRYDCGVDWCEETVHFCSSRFRRCVFCSDHFQDCFSYLQQPNCTYYCMNKWLDSLEYNREVSDDTELRVYKSLTFVFMVGFIFTVLALCWIKRKWLLQILKKCRFYSRMQSINTRSSGEGIEQIVGSEINQIENSGNNTPQTQLKQVNTDIEESHRRGTRISNGNTELIQNNFPNKNDNRRRTNVYRNRSDVIDGGENIPLNQLDIPNSEINDIELSANVQTDQIISYPHPLNVENNHSGCNVKVNLARSQHRHNEQTAVMGTRPCVKMNAIVNDTGEDTVDVRGYAHDNTSNDRNIQTHPKVITQERPRSDIDMNNQVVKWSRNLGESNSEINYLELNGDSMNTEHFASSPNIFSGEGNHCGITKKVNVDQSDHRPETHNHYTNVDKRTRPTAEINAIVHDTGKGDAFVTSSTRDHTIQDQTNQTHPKVITELMTPNCTDIDNQKAICNCKLEEGNEMRTLKSTTDNNSRNVHPHPELSIMSSIERGPQAISHVNISNESGYDTHKTYSQKDRIQVLKKNETL